MTGNFTKPAFKYGVSVNLQKLFSIKWDQKTLIEK